MSAILYYIFLYPLSLLPYPVLYLISDFLYLLLYYVIGYRKKVVQKNITLSFPDKSPLEIKKITKDFYHHFSDLIVETIKTFSLNPKRANKRMTVVNPEITDAYAAQGKDILIVGGHYANWEAYTYTANQHQHQLYALYTPLSNSFFNKKMKSSREKCGMKLVSTSVYKELLNQKHDSPVAYIYSIDQSPRKGSGYRMNFLNQDSMVLFGTEKTAKAYDLPIFFGSIRKIKRGYYEIEYELIVNNPLEYKYGEITEKITRKLEGIIQQTPAYWLWTHKRWKHNVDKDE